MEPVVFIRKCRAWPRGVKQSDAKVVTRCGVRNRGNAPLSVDFRLVFRRCSRLIVRTLGSRQTISRVSEAKYLAGAPKPKKLTH